MLAVPSLQLFVTVGPGIHTPSYNQLLYQEGFAVSLVLVLQFSVDG